MRCVTNPEPEIGRVVIDGSMDRSRVDGSNLRSQCELHGRPSCKAFANLARSARKQMLLQMNKFSAQMMKFDSNKGTVA